MRERAGNRNGRAGSYRRAPPCWSEADTPLELVAVREVIVVVVSSLRRRGRRDGGRRGERRHSGGGRLDGSRGRGNSGRRKGAARDGRRNRDGVRNAKNLWTKPAIQREQFISMEPVIAHLADVQVATIGGNLGVVGVEQRRVDVVVGGDTVAGVVGLDDVGGGAVLALSAEAENLTGLEVIAPAVNRTGVHDGELVAEGNII